MTETKDNKKANIREILLNTGRELVKSKGADFLTVRKLSEASGCSVGTIYNQFANMDNFVIEQNMMTLDELSGAMRQIARGNDAYKNLSRFTDVYVGWVLSNANLWFLLYNFHLHHSGGKLPQEYRRRFMKIVKIWEPDFDLISEKFGMREKKVFRQVLLLSMFTLSSFLTTQQTSKLSRSNICKLLLNAYLAGIKVLRRGE